MIRKYLPYISLFVLMVLCAGCSVEDEGLATDLYHSSDSSVPCIPTMIRFESPDGENLMTSCPDIRQESFYYLFKFDEVPWLDVRCVRGSDGAQMTLSSPSWIQPHDEEQLSLYGQGPLLILSWIDFDFYVAQNVTLPHKEKYTLHIRNSYLWTDEEHTIEWGIEFYTRQKFQVFSCAIDGIDSSQSLEEAKHRGSFIGLVHLKSY